MTPNGERSGARSFVGGLDSGFIVISDKPQGGAIFAGIGKEMSCDGFQDE